MKRLTARELLQKLRDNTISAEERQLLEAWYVDYTNRSEPFDDIPAFLKDMEMLDQVFLPNKAIQPKSRIFQLPSLRIAAAASLIVISLGIYFYRQSDSSIVDNSISQQIQAQPGKIGATLTLADGRKISLGNLTNGDTTIDGGIHIMKTADGQLIYELSDSNTSENKIHTLSTGRGETIALTLPDKSKIWLNASSSISYPTHIARQTERHVTLSGEAYFEVFKDARHPFVVDNQGQQVEVLGTSFNIQAYSDDREIKTTLLEGSIKISTVSSGSAKVEKILKPNQQATVQTGKIAIQDVIADDAIAWKQGFFLFNSERLESVLNKIARWYKVDIVFENPTLKNETMLGTMSRYDQLAKVLKVIERTGVAQFEIRNNTIYVKNK
ncbi:MAG: DUF4974 domain-containing protein [Sphingobacterium sp.]|jgi:ferric-dicitrate binding protein FerR (iron transport regulator)|nr:DUF4974 domain-containing protein [Sphingobacterium sp.]